ncbi:MAG TPA: 50S ribosomal protein L10 [Caldithrix abyssi]|uniref:Large ribosomal subunit protein uL10 n=1 Tax=Caldithrix abyssi TaxID=187145 RepID=A0A7V4WUB9_CALAY|nr:50S ribosomal protein L10 [Caldithrix abyssi]
MATPQKIEIVDTYTEKFKEAKSVYLADYTGIDVQTVTELRQKFREAGVEYKVLKNRLAKRALNNAGVSALDEHLKGVTSFIIGYDDPVTPARIIKEFNKPKERLKLKVVYLEGKVFDEKEAKKLADLPTREVLLSMLLGALQSPMTKLAGTLQASMQKLVRTLDAVKENKK